MKAIELLLEDDEIMILRSQARMMQIMLPEKNEVVDSYLKKILAATGDLKSDYMDEIGVMQRAMRRIKEMPEYQKFMDNVKDIERLLMSEMAKDAFNNLFNK